MIPKLFVELAKQLEESAVELWFNRTDQIIDKMLKEAAQHDRPVTSRSAAMRISNEMFGGVLGTEDVAYGALTTGVGQGLWDIALEKEDGTAIPMEEAHRKLRDHDRNAEWMKHTLVTFPLTEKGKAKAQALSEEP